MKILIDTNVLVWLSSNPTQLGSQAVQLLEDSRNTVFVSYFSLFELRIKAAVGKANFDMSVIDVLPEAGLALLTPATAHIQNYRIFNKDNTDPFDNMLIATAITEKCTFMTSDTMILNTKAPAFKPVDSSL